MSTTAARHPRREAQAVLGHAGFARVLEPSPPAVSDGQWFADDPVSAEAPAGQPVVGPVPGPDVARTWDEWLAGPGYDDHAVWAANRWLGAYRRLPPAPQTYVDTRLALHRLAVYVVSPARRRTNTKIGLRFTMGAILPLREFVDAPDQRAAGLDFFRARRSLLLEP